VPDGGPDGGTGGQDLVDLLRASQFVFEATVAGHQRSTVSDIPVDDHTLVVRVDLVLQAPAALARAAGSEVTVQLLAGTPVPSDGERAVFFTTAIAFGTGIAVAEVGRAGTDAVGPLGAVAFAAGAPATVVGARPGRPHPVLEAAERLEDERLQAHAASADAIVIGRVTGLEKVGPVAASEHDRDIWRATIDVRHVEKGDVPDRVQVLFPMSHDVRWARVPKPQAGQDGVWVLHATQGDDATLAPFALLDADDAQPPEALQRLRPEEP